MAANKRSPIQIEKDRALIADLYLQGLRQMDIAERLNMTQQMVSYDLQAVQKQWRERTALDIDEAKRQELAKIDRLEREYWSAWDESRGKRTVTSKKMSEASGTKRAEASTREEDMLGDPRFLAGVQWCIDRRCKILGVDAPTKQDVSGQLTVKVERADDVERGSRTND
jgi:predicted transcriptional regulator